MISFKYNNFYLFHNFSFFPCPNCHPRSWRNLGKLQCLLLPPSNAGSLFLSVIDSQLSLSITYQVISYQRSHRGEKYANRRFVAKLPPSRFLLNPAVCAATATSFSSSWNCAFLATKSVSQLSSTIEAQLPLTITPISPCAVFLPSSLLALSRPSSSA